MRDLFLCVAFVFSVTTKSLNQVFLFALQRCVRCVVGQEQHERLVLWCLPDELNRILRQDICQVLAGVWSDGDFVSSQIELVVVLCLLFGNPAVGIVAVAAAKHSELIVKSYGQGRRVIAQSAVPFADLPM